MTSSNWHLTTYRGMGGRFQSHASVLHDQIAENDPNGEGWRASMLFARRDFDKLPIGGEAWAQFMTWTREHVQTYKEAAEAFRAAVEAWNGSPTPLTVEALAHAAGILPDPVAVCDHPIDALKTDTTGARKFAGGDVDDNLKEIVLCTICGHKFTDKELAERYPASILPEQDF